MDINSVQKTLINRAMFVRGLYWLMTPEEREYFWVREAEAVIRDQSSGNPELRSSARELTDDPD